MQIQEAGGVASVATAPGAAADVRILIVEDDVNNSDLAQRIVRHGGYTPILAWDGFEALSLAAAMRPSLILMDLSLPGMDGWEATRRLKARPEMAGVPIIALSANAMAEDKARARAAGSDAYLTKPYKPRELLEAIRAHLAAAPQPRRLP